MDLTVRNKTLVALLLIALLIVLVLSESGHPPLPPLNVPGSQQDGSPPPAADPSVHLTMGNPSGATDREDDTDNYLMRKPYFALAYNNAKGTPSWVSWCLRAGDFGPAKRVEFFPDATLPSGFKHVYPKEYTDSGFDRGHLCPRSDRTSTPEAAKATFVMTNIMPQAPHVNQRGWNDLEDYCRSLVRGRDQTLYIVAGPQGVGGEGSQKSASSISRGRVTVPARCWKVVLAVNGGTGGDDDIRRVTPSTWVIAVVMPNDQSVGHDWGRYRTSVREVERLTGYTFFDRVPAQVMDPLKEQVDDEKVPVGASSRED